MVTLDEPNTRTAILLALRRADAEYRAGVAAIDADGRQLRRHRAMIAADGRETLERREAIAAWPFNPSDAKKK